MRLIGDLSANVTMSLKNDLVSSVAFSIALDEFTDIQDNPQLAVFVCYVSKYFCVKELLELVALKDTTEVDIKMQSILCFLKVFSLNAWLNLYV